MNHTFDMSEETKSRILDAAERLLAERGFSAASLRAITAAAGVNLGAVNYHFRSKQELIRAVFIRRLEPINRERLKALDACEAAARDKPVPLEDLLHAFLIPMMSLGKEAGIFLRLMGRMYTDPSLDIQHIFKSEIEVVVQRFLRAFRRTLPYLPPEDLYWRLIFTVGAMSLILSSGPLLSLISGGLCNPGDPEEAGRMLKAYAGPALRAPAAERRQRKRATMPAS